MDRNIASEVSCTYCKRVAILRQLFLVPVQQHDFQINRTKITNKILHTITKVLSRLAKTNASNDFVQISQQFDYSNGDSFSTEKRRWRFMDSRVRVHSLSALVRDNTLKWEHLLMWPFSTALPCWPNIPCYIAICHKLGWKSYDAETDTCARDSLEFGCVCWRLRRHRHWVQHCRQRGHFLAKQGLCPGPSSSPTSNGIITFKKSLIRLNKASRTTGSQILQHPCMTLSFSGEILRAMVWTQQGNPTWIWRGCKTFKAGAQMLPLWILTLNIEIWETNLKNAGKHYWFLQSFRK